MDITQKVADLVRLTLNMPDKTVYTAQEDMPLSPDIPVIYIELSKPPKQFGTPNIEMMAKTDAVGNVINDINETITNQYLAEFQIDFLGFEIAKALELPTRLQNQLFSDMGKLIQNELGIGVGKCEFSQNFKELINEKWINRSIVEIQIYFTIIIVNSIAEYKQVEIQNVNTNQNFIEDIK